MRRELDAYRRADLVLTVSEQEAKLVNDVLTDPTQAMWVPLWEEFPVSTIPFEERRGTLFVGNFRHPPNEQALEWLCREIVPRIPRGAGAQPGHDRRQRLGGTAARTLQRDARCGSGRLRSIPGSLLQPIQVVRRPPAYRRRNEAQADPGHDGWGADRRDVDCRGGTGRGRRRGVLIADDAADFAESINSHIEDPSRWRKLAQRGRDRIIRSNGPETARRQLTEAFRRVLAPTSV